MQSSLPPSLHPWQLPSIQNALLPYPSTKTNLQFPHLDFVLTLCKLTFPDLVFTDVAVEQLQVWYSTIFHFQNLIRLYRRTIFGTTASLHYLATDILTYNKATPEKNQLLIIVWNFYQFWKLPWGLISCFLVLLFAF